MAKVITDERLIDEFLYRGVDAVYPGADKLKTLLMSGKRLRAYQGYDPTGKYLHVGHAMGIRAMRLLQQLGHEVIFLVGDFTARVGDPDKDKARKLLTVEEIESNMSGWKEQAAQLIDFGGDNPVQFKHNFEWLSKLRFEDVIELMSHMTVQRMLERDMFERRMKENDPIYVQEFIYPLMQGYDSVAMEVDIEICGADQTFNALVGRQLSRQYLSKEKFVRTNQMMDAPDGRTMSKTKGNGINLGDTSEDMYGKAMSYPDHLITKGFELLTSLPMEQIKEIEKSMNNGDNPMEFKKLLAYTIVSEIKGKNEAKGAATHFEKTVQNKELPTDIPNHKITSSKGILDILVETGLASSNGEGRRLIKQGGIKLNGEPVTDERLEISGSKEGDILQRGKRQLVKLLS